MATTAPTQSATSPGVSPPSVPSADQAFSHVQTLAGVIGPRVVGTEGRDAATNYLASQLESIGYRVERQPFTARFSEDRSSVTASFSQEPFRVLAFNRSRNGSAEAPLVDVGRAELAEIPSGGLSGQIALIERGGLMFQEKVENVARAGALAAIIFNNDEGLFGGTLRETSAIPSVLLSRTGGLTLRDAINLRGNVTVRVVVEIADVERAGVNVIARPNQDPCAWLVGGHYDTVADAPGASDNASGIAVTLEVARVMAPLAKDLDLCFVAFDADEEGLFGSAHFAEIMRPSERDALRAFINLDTVGVGTAWLAIGTPSLTRIMQAAGQANGVTIEVGDLPPNASSDHASFLQKGLPAVFLYRADDNLIHTPQDVIERVPPETLEQAARLVIGFIQRAMA